MNRHDDLGLGLEAARQVSRIRVHVIDDDRLLVGGSGAADAAPERNAGVRRGLADERPEHELVAFEQVNADPGVGRDFSREQPDGFFQRARRVTFNGLLDLDEQLVVSHRLVHPLSILQFEQHQYQRRR